MLLLAVSHGLPEVTAVGLLAGRSLLAALVPSIIIFKF